VLSALWGWLVAFFFTQVFELPIYWRVTKSLRVSFLASALTHPIVWFVFPVLMRWGVGYVLMVALAEIFAVAVEAWWLRLNGVARPWLWSFVANAFSATCGLVLRELTGIL
jgi:hypothetical protein